MTNSDKREIPCRAAKLVAEGVAKGHFTIHHVAAVLQVDEHTLGSYMSGGERMPLDKQTRFAQFLTLLVPALSRQGRNLAAHIDAARRYEAGETQTHHENAPGRFY